MAEDAKSTYYSPQVKGSAVVLSNSWLTPLGILRQRQQQQQQDQLHAQEQAAQQEKDTLERVKSFKPEMGDLWEPDLEQGAQAVRAMRDYVSDNLAKNIDATNAVRHPRENAELNRMMLEANDLVSRSKQQKSYYDDFMKQLGGDKAGYYNTSKGYELAQQYRFAKTPEERANIQLELKRLYNLPAYASDVFKDLKPETKTTITLPKDGSQITEDITTYSPAQMDYATSAIKMMPEFQQALEDEYSQMTEEQQRAVKGFDGLVQSRAEELALGHQKEDIKRRRGPDAVLNANRNFNHKVAQAGKGAQNKDYQKALDRADFIHATDGGDWDKAQSIIDSKQGGGNIVGVAIVPKVEALAIARGRVGDAPYQSKPALGPKPIIRLTVSEGSVTDGEPGSKLKSTATRTFDLDTNEANWREQFNTLMNNGKGYKVPTELYNKAWQERGYDQPASAKEDATDDPFADFDQPAADPNDPFADFK